MDNWGVDEVGIDSVHCLPPEEGAPQRAMVLLHWWSTGASFSGHGVVQLFESASGYPTVSQQIYYISKAPGSGASWDMRSLTLTVKATHYTAFDARCCPSKLDIITFRLTQQGFVKRAQRTISLDQVTPSSVK